MSLITNKKGKGKGKWIREEFILQNKFRIFPGDLSIYYKEIPLP